MKNVLHYLMSHRSLVLICLAALCLSLSPFEMSTHNNRAKRLVRVEKVLRKKQASLEQIAHRALAQRTSDWLDEKGVEEDMVVYKYVNDSLVSWVNTFPIINDGYSPDALFPNLSFFSRNRIWQKPLSSANEQEQYMNLGSGWYVVQVYEKNNISIITGILIQTSFPFSNNFVESSINKELHVPDYCSIVPLNLDEGFVVFGKEDHALFNILSDVSLQRFSKSIILRWLFLLFLVLALFSFYIEHIKPLNAALTVAVLIILRFMVLLFAPLLQMNSTFFSPLLYAGGFMENSFAAMMTNSLTMLLCALVVYMARHELSAWMNRTGQAGRIATSSALVLFGCFILWLIHHTLHSLTANSNIVLELYKLDELTLYTMLGYLAGSSLFVALLYLILTVGVMYHDQVPRIIEQRRFPIFFVLAASLYTLIFVSYYGQIKEFNRDQVWTQKMAVERDLELEVQLRRVEKLIEADPVLSIMLQMEQDQELILSRIKENYLADFFQRYRIQITVCSPGDMLAVDGLPAPVSCYNFFHSEILRYGTPLSEDSHFYHRNNDLGNISYVGVYTFYSYGGSIDLYIEIDSRYIKDVLGYPSLLSDKSQLDKFKLPHDYSYAKYINNKLVANSGQFSYPGKVDFPVSDGFSHRKMNGSLHYFYKVENKVLLISRPIRSPFPYLISFSYIFIFYGICVAFALGVFRRRELSIHLPKNSFRRKITWLLVGSLVAALAFIALGSLGFGLRLYEQTNRKQMQDQMQAAQSSLEEYIRHADRSNDAGANLTELVNVITSLSSNIQIQVTLFDSHGRLMRSSLPEIYEQHLSSARMDDVAFKELRERGSTQFIQREHIGSFEYYSLYAPLYNTQGNLVAYINVPYMSGQTDVTKDTSSILAAVVNLYLLLLIAAIIMSFTISNQLTKPLEELGEKMSRVDVTKTPEHILYTNDDELGALVNAYNKMADDLEESTRRLAQSEREQAWREMARQIAHEIKNPLTPMRLSIQHLMRLKQEDSPKWTQRFDKVATSLLEQIDILAEAASEFSNFSRFYMEDATRVDLYALIKEQMVLFNTSDHIKIHFQSTLQTAFVEGRRSQLIRLLVNLLSNAMQAVEEQSIGVITITLDRQEGQYRLRIADNGPGVMPENRDKLFKPNFTTKSSGTGLGLAICRGIIEQSQGSMFYSSSEWGGACFNVLLPVADKTT